MFENSSDNDNRLYFPVDLVTIEKFVQLVGYTKRAVEGKIYRDQWKKNKIWFQAPDGRNFISLSQFEKWARHDHQTD